MGCGVGEGWEKLMRILLAHNANSMLEGQKITYLQNDNKQ